MANEDLTERVPIATQPFDSTDPPRFSQLVETAKDVFAKELTDFFSYKTDDALKKINETPTIQKFSLGANIGTESSLQTVVNLIMEYGDTIDKFPMVAVTTTNTRERKMGLGSNFAAHVQYPPSLVGTETGPFNLEPPAGADPWYIDIYTWPRGSSDTPVRSRILFSDYIFPDLSSIDIDQLCRVINKTQALYYQFSATNDGYLRISAGGPCAADYNQMIEINAGSAGALTALGLTIGDVAYSTDTDNPPRNRYIVAADMTVNIDVVTESLNTMTELSDLVFNFFAFYMEKRRFEFFGRSYFDRELTPEEWFHISLNNQFAWSGEVISPRQGGDQYDHIYAMRGSIPIFIEDFIDRKLVDEPIFLQRDLIIPSEDIPVGDYGGENYLKHLL